MVINFAFILISEYTVSLMKAYYFCNLKTIKRNQEDRRMSGWLKNVVGSMEERPDEQMEGQMNGRKEEGWEGRRERRMNECR